MTGKVFLNYRRADAEAWADRLFERLIQQFPRENVFMDIDGRIPFGFPWADWLDSQVAACDLMLVLIGRSWVAEFKVRSEAHERDYVRVEIESALKRKIPVVPVLLGDTPVPKVADLPETMRPLLGLQAARLQRMTFDSDAEALAKGVARSIALAHGEGPAASGTPWTKRLLYQAEGRIKVDAKIIHGTPDGWFKPGAGRSEWFRDIDMSPEMVVVPSGSFTMGANDHGSEEPLHEVTIKAPFAVGRFAITFAEWDAAGLPHKPDDQEWGRGRRPVINVSWIGAKTYASWLSQKTGKNYKLLSEAEWEYCCRAGMTTKYAFGDRITRDQAQFSEGECGSAEQTVEVGRFPPNAWGLHDMHGNVWEWCGDNVHANYKGAPGDGSIWSGGDASLRILRGGSWRSFPAGLRSAIRNGNQPDRQSIDIGFRLARTL